MFIKRRSNVLFRNFQTFGYLTDNRNFGYNYKLKSSCESFVGDKIVSQSGAIFLSVLGKIPQTFMRGLPSPRKMKDAIGG